MAIYCPSAPIRDRCLRPQSISHSRGLVSSDDCGFPSPYRQPEIIKKNYLKLFFHQSKHLHPEKAPAQFLTISPVASTALTSVLLRISNARGGSGPFVLFLNILFNQFL